MGAQVNGRQRVMQLTPLFVSVKEAAAVLSVSPWAMYRLLDQGKVEARYHGTRRLVDYASLCDYAKSLPATPEKDGAA